MNNLSCSILILYLQSWILYALSYRETINVSASEGEDVTLHVSERGGARITDVWWVKAGGNHFATISDGKVDIRDHRYEGRLRCPDGASLTFIHVVEEDQGVYTANVALTDEEIYLAKYHLSVFKKVIDSHEASMLGACSVSCRGKGIHVTLTCDQTSPQDIAAMYDPDTCTCGKWKEDCAPCVLNKYCGKDRLPDIPKASTPGSFRGNGRDVTLAYDQTSPQNITAVYDPDPCTCAPCYADCAPCDLEQYCREGDRTDLMHRILLNLFLVFLVFLAVPTVMIMIATTVIQARV